MKNTSPIPSRFQLRVKQRLRVLEYAKLRGIHQASRYFGIERKTIRTWRDRLLAQGTAGLIPRYPKTRRSRLPEDLLELIRHARVKLGYGAARTCVWLRRVHGRVAHMATVQRTFRRMGLPYLPNRSKRERRPRQMKLFEKADPGESVQVDVKFVRVAGRRLFQYTALDDCTRYRVLRLYRRHHVSSSLRFLDEVRGAMPFPIRKVQCDNGHEFPFEFELEVERAGMTLRRIRPRCPQQNGKVERSHRIDDEEFWSGQRQLALQDADEALALWERRYNHDRFSLALGGLTPAEKLAGRLQPAPLQRPDESPCPPTSFPSDLL